MAENNDIDLNLGAAVLQYMLEADNALDIPMELSTNSTLYRAGSSDVDAGAAQLLDDHQDLTVTLTAEQMAALEDFASNANMIPAEDLAEIQARMVQVERGVDGSLIFGEKTSPDFKAGFGADVQAEPFMVNKDDSSFSDRDGPGNSFRDAIVETQAQIEQIRLGEDGGGAVADTQVVNLLQGLHSEILSLAIEAGKRTDGVMSAEDQAALETRLAEITGGSDGSTIAVEDLDAIEAQLEKIVHGEDAADIHVGPLFEGETVTPLDNFGDGVSIPSISSEPDTYYDVVPDYQLDEPLNDGELKLLREEIIGANLTEIDGTGGVLESVQAAERGEVPQVKTGPAPEQGDVYIATPLT